MNNRLYDRRYLAGSEYSIADMISYPWTTSWQMRGIDLDEFKAFNDANGHLAGDDLLRDFATELRARMRTIDFVARFGGEEFSAVLSGTDATGAERLLDDLHRLLRESERTKEVTFSAGVALWDGTESGEELIGRADRALYAAKAAGRDRTIVDHVDR